MSSASRQDQHQGSTKKFVFDPRSMMLPHERTAKESATNTNHTKHSTTKPTIIARTESSNPVKDVPQASSSPPESQPPPYSKYQDDIHHGSDNATSHISSSIADRLAPSPHWIPEGVDPLDTYASGSQSQSSSIPLDGTTDEDEEELSESPALLSDWEVVETLGTGTFGRVLLVRLRPPYRHTNHHPIFPAIKFRCTEPGEPTPEQTAYADAQLPHYAMKVLAKSEIVRLKQVEHINSERAILERVRHPFLVDLYGTYQDHLNVYMLLSYVPGGELFSHLRRAGRFSPDVTRFYIASIILAIDYLHERDIIYRDLKPENLLLDRDGYLRIADFGFAKIIEDRTFTLCGTPEYLAPEIVLSKGHGKAVDWWALGILTFEMLAGYPPFFDDHPMGIYEKILANKIAFPSHIDPYAKDLIRRLLTADRSKRLGNLRGGAKDVMRHKWFTGVDWATLERKETGAPIIPHVASLGDSQNFQRYPPPTPSELPGILGIPQGAADDPYKHLFHDFVFPPAAS